MQEIDTFETKILKHVRESRNNVSYSFRTEKIVNRLVNRKVNLSHIIPSIFEAANII